MGKWRSECRSSEVFVVREEVKRGRGRRANKGGVKCRKGRERVLLFSLSIIFVTSSIV